MYSKRLSKYIRVFDFLRDVLPDKDTPILSIRVIFKYYPHTISFFPGTVPIVFSIYPETVLSSFY